MTTREQRKELLQHVPPLPEQLPEPRTAVNRVAPRTVDEIVAEIHALHRASIIEYGNLLIELREQCEPGKWLALLDSEGWSADTAQRCIKVAELSSRFRNLRNLKLAKTTLYQLTHHERGNELPAIIAELEKHATTTRLRPRDAERVINIGIGRHRYGDHPEATLQALADLDGDDIKNWQDKMVAALLEHQPTTVESADEIVRGVIRDERLRVLPEGDDDSEDDAEAETDEGGANAEPEPEPDEDEADDEQFEKAGGALLERAVGALLDIKMRGTPVAGFVDDFTAAELRDAANFLMDIAAAVERDDERDAR